MLIAYTVVEKTRKTLCLRHCGGDRQPYRPWIAAAVNEDTARLPGLSCAVPEATSPAAIDRKSTAPLPCPGAALPFRQLPCRPVEAFEQLPIRLDDQVAPQLERRRHEPVLDAERLRHDVEPAHALDRRQGAGWRGATASPIAALNAGSCASAARSGSQLVGSGEAAHELLVRHDQRHQMRPPVAVDQRLADLAARSSRTPSTRAGATLSPPELTIMSFLRSVILR